MSERTGISSQADYNPDHFRFARQSGLRDRDFRPPSRIDKLGAAFLSLVLSGAGVFMVLGLAFGWIR